MLGIVLKATFSGVEQGREQGGGVLSILTEEMKGSEGALSLFSFAAPQGPDARRLRGLCFYVK